jgi:hypothetical protein
MRERVGVGCADARRIAGDECENRGEGEEGSHGAPAGISSTSLVDLATFFLPVGLAAGAVFRLGAFLLVKFTISPCAKKVPERCR